MKKIILTLVVSTLLFACSKTNNPQNTASHEPTTQEMKERNDTSYYKPKEAKKAENF